MSPSFVGGRREAVDGVALGGTLGFGVELIGGFFLLADLALIFCLLFSLLLHYKTAHAQILLTKC